jgi:hypothetical protein
VREHGTSRGASVEKVPDDHVEIQLANGHTRTVKMSEVEYVEPANESAPAPTPPAPPPSPPVPPGTATIDIPMARLELTAPQPGLTFHRKAFPAPASSSARWSSASSWSSSAITPT